MKMSKRNTATTTISMVLVLLVVSLPVLLSGLPTVDSSASATSAIVNATLDKADLLQYEWTQAARGDQHSTRFNDGPAPNAADILWQVNLPQGGTYHGGAVSGFNGKVFVATRSILWALDPFDGHVLWSIPAPTNGTFDNRGNFLFKVDDTHAVEWVLYQTTHPWTYSFMGINTDTGAVLWVSTPKVGYGCLQTSFIYADDLKLCVFMGSDERGEPGAYQALDFSDITKPPTEKWTFINDGSGHHANLVYGDGKIFLGSYVPHLCCLNATTGQVLWDTPTKGQTTYGPSYYQGKVLWGTLNNDFYCFDGDTGEILWTFNPGTFPVGFWGGGCGAAYGMVYQVNADGYLYAIDVNTGKMVWRYEGPGTYYGVWPCIADGKVYANTGQKGARNYVTGEWNYQDETACLDAFTGKLLWKVPIMFGGTSFSTMGIAFGNLYASLFKGSYTTVYAYGPPQPWGQFRRDPAHTAQGQSGPTNLTLRWKFTADAAIISSPAIVDGKVYFGSYDKNMYCIDAENGSLVWKFNTGAAIYYSPAVFNGKVYTGAGGAQDASSSGDGWVYCIDAITGVQLWKTNIGFVPYSEMHYASPKFQSSPCLVNGMLYVGSTDGYIYCLNADTGSIAWKYNTGFRIVSSPAVVDGMVYAASENGTLFKLDGASSALIWRCDMPGPDRYGGVTAAVHLKSSPTVADGMVFIGSAGDLPSYVYCINSTTGSVIWRYACIGAMDSVDTPSYANGKVYFSESTGYLACVNATNAQLIWHTWLIREGISSATYADGKIYQCRNLPIIYVVNATDGEKLSWYQLEGLVWGSPAIWEGKVYVGSFDWNLYCFEEASPTPPMQFSMTLNIDRTQVNKTNSESVTASGTFFPLLMAPLKVSFVKPDGGRVDMDATCNLSAGTFTVSYTPDVVGKWSVVAWVAGNEVGSYCDSYSNAKDLNVIEYTPPETQPPPEESTTTGMPIEYIIAAIAVIAIVAVAVVGYIMMKRRKK